MWMQLIVHARKLAMCCWESVVYKMFQRIGETKRNIDDENYEKYVPCQMSVP